MLRCSGQIPAAVLIGCLQATSSGRIELCDRTGRVTVLAAGVSTSHLGQWLACSTFVIAEEPNDPGWSDPSSVPAYANSAGISSAFGQGATISRSPVVYIDMAHCTILHAGWQDESLSTQLKAKQAGGASNKPSESRTDRGPSKKRIALGKKTGTKAGAGAGAAATLSAQTATRVPELRVCIQYKTLLEKAADNAQIVFQCEMFVLPAGGARREDQGEDRQQDSTVGAVTERMGCVDALNAPQSSDAASKSTPERVVEQLRLASAEFRKPASNWHCMIEMGGIYVLRNLLVQTLIIGSKEICTYAADSESTMETVAATDQTAVETLASQKSIENAAQVLSTVSDALMLRASAHRFKRGSGGGGGSSVSSNGGSMCENGKQFRTAHAT